jgi:hypothetical protein
LKKIAMMTNAQCKAAGMCARCIDEQMICGLLPSFFINRL